MSDDANNYRGTATVQYNLAMAGFNIPRTTAEVWVNKGIREPNIDGRCVELTLDWLQTLTSLRCSTRKSCGERQLFSLQRINWPTGTRVVLGKHFQGISSTACGWSRTLNKKFGHWGEKVDNGYALDGE
ncbi:hypothetical protein B0H14DRAFT_2619280 [Mycena olivaceomarginata]|nr:hypothetical protein B0H14DRAFT_2619280 [Mycena olivaceomarginata]